MKQLLSILWHNKALVLFLLVFAAGAVFYYRVHRWPHTQNAFVIANVRPVSALVPGRVTDIYVSNNQTVKKGDKLFTVYQRPYQLAVEQASNQLHSAVINAQVLQAQVLKDQAMVEQCGFNYQNEKYLADMAQLLATKNADSRKDAEIHLRAAQMAQASLKVAQATMDVTKLQLQQALSEAEGCETQLAERQVALDQTTVHANADGTVANMHSTVGAYATPGVPVFAFVETGRWWVQANLKENELANVRAGQKAEVRLWMYPNHTFQGVVDQIDWGVNRQSTAQGNALPEVQKENEWFLLPQRFPVQIRITNPSPEYPLHIGASATVTILGVKSDELQELLWFFKTF